MANQELLELLKQGSQTWNAWREKHSDQHIDFSSAKLCNLDLSNMNLSEADLSMVDLSNTILSHADLADVDLRGSELIHTNLYNAKLFRANLSGGHFHGTNLRGANLSFSNMSYSLFTEVDMSNAILDHTLFGDMDFHDIKGLETVIHYGPSPLSVNSIYISHGTISDAFVRGTGAPDTFIEFIHSQFPHAIK
jgi:uncharacterized protein YjbI with pentapeptide repeats